MIPDLNSKVVFLDNHLLVMYKDAGLLSQGDRTGDMDLLTLSKYYLKKKFHKDGNVFLGLVHRLDRPVSGLMVFARTSKAASRLSEQFRNHRPLKKYLVLVSGNVAGTGNCTDYIAKKEQKAIAVKVDSKGAKLAELNWRNLKNFKDYSLLEVELITGRFHQIRFQMAQMGHAVLGDRKYGSKLPFVKGTVALHAHSLFLEHPVRKSPMEWQVLPEKWPEEALEAIKESLVIDLEKKGVDFEQ